MLFRHELVEASPVRSRARLALLVVTALGVLVTFVAWLVPRPVWPGPPPIWVDIDDGHLWVDPVEASPASLAWCTGRSAAQLCTR